MQKIITSSKIGNKNMENMPRPDDDKAGQCRQAQKRQQILAKAATQHPKQHTTRQCRQAGQGYNKVALHEAAIFIPALILCKAAAKGDEQGLQIKLLVQRQSGHQHSDHAPKRLALVAVVLVKAGAPHHSNRGYGRKCIGGADRPSSDCGITNGQMPACG